MHSTAFDIFLCWHINASNHLRYRLLTIKQHCSIWLGPRPSIIVKVYTSKPFCNPSVLNHVVDCSIHHCKRASTNLKYCRILFAFAPQSEVPRRDLERPCTIVLPAESCLQTNTKSSLKRIIAVVATPSNMPAHTYRSLSSKYRAMHTTLQHVGHHSGVHLVPGLGESVATLAFLLPLPEQAFQGVIRATAACLATEQGSCRVCRTSIAPKTVA